MKERTFHVRMRVSMQDDVEVTNEDLVRYLTNVLELPQSEDDVYAVRDIEVTNE